MDKKKEQIQTIIVISCVIFAVLMLVAMIMNLVKLAGASSRKAALEQEIAYLNELIDSNGSEIDYRKTKEYIDKYARDYLDMVGKDEIVFVGK